MNKKIRGSIMLFIAALIWGTAFVAQSEGMKYIEPFTYNALRMLIGGVVLIPVIAAFKLFGGERGITSLKMTIIGGICCGAVLFTASSLQQIAIVSSTAGKAGFITSLYIIIVPLLKLVILREKTSPKILLYAVIAIIGFYLLCMSGDFQISQSDLLMLLCAVAFAGHIIVIDYFIGKNTDGVMMASVQFFVSGILAACAALLFENPQLSSIMDAKFTILYTGLLSSGVAYTLQILGQKDTEPTAATMIMSLESVVAAISGCVILGERLTLREGIGCMLVFTAVILAQLTAPKDVME